MTKVLEEKLAYFGNTVLYNNDIETNQWRLNWSKRRKMSFGCAIENWFYKTFPTTDAGEKFLLSKCSVGVLLSYSVFKKTFIQNKNSINKIGKSLHWMWNWKLVKHSVTESEYSSLTCKYRVINFTLQLQILLYYAHSVYKFTYKNYSKKENKVKSNQCEKLRHFLIDFLSYFL